MREKGREREKKKELKIKTMFFALLGIKPYTLAHTYTQGVSIHAK